MMRWFLRSTAIAPEFLREIRKENCAVGKISKLFFISRVTKTDFHENLCFGAFLDVFIQFLSSRLLFSKDIFFISLDNFKEKWGKCVWDDEKVKEKQEKSKIFLWIVSECVWKGNLTRKKKRKKIPQWKEKRKVKANARIFYIIYFHSVSLINPSSSSSFFHFPLHHRDITEQMCVGVRKNIQFFSYFFSQEIHSKSSNIFIHKKNLQHNGKWDENEVNRVNVIFWVDM